MKKGARDGTVPQFSISTILKSSDDCFFVQNKAHGSWVVGGFFERMGLFCTIFDFWNYKISHFWQQVSSNNWKQSWSPNRGFAFCQIMMNNAWEHGILVEICDLRPHRVDFCLIRRLHQLRILLTRCSKLTVEFSRVLLKDFCIFSGDKKSYFLRKRVTMLQNFVEKYFFLRYVSKWETEKNKF